MQLEKQTFAPLKVLVLACLWVGVSVNAADAQSYDPSEWYGDVYPDPEGYFYDSMIYNPNDYYDYDYYHNDYYDDGIYDDDYYDDGFYDDDYYDNGFYDHGYDSKYFPGTNSSFPSPYEVYGPNLGPNLYGGDRYYGPHFRYDGEESLYEEPYGYNNYYYKDYGVNDAYDAYGNDYFTEDWYEGQGAFDTWY